MLLDRISIAPMLECTDRHFRYLMRLISKRTLLYTEMLTIKDVLENKHEPLQVNPIEHPVAIQLGGSNPALLAKCAQLAVNAKFDEINLNVGCPSGRVQAGGIGACLMLQPNLVAECIDAMQAVSNVPVTVKCRLGVDHFDSYEHLFNFISTIYKIGCRKVIIHARKAWLQGLSPKENREIPPLCYPSVYRLKHDFPDLYVVLNGGIQTIDAMDQHLEKVDGVMVGRAIYQNPFLFENVDSHFYGLSHQSVEEVDIVLKYISYVEEELKTGVRLRSMTRHLLGLFSNKPRASYWRRHLSNPPKGIAGDSNVIREALAQIKR